MANWLYFTKKKKNFFKVKQVLYGHDMYFTASAFLYKVMCGKARSSHYLGPPGTYMNVPVYKPLSQPSEDACCPGNPEAPTKTSSLSLVLFLHS